MKSERFIENELVKMIEISSEFDTSEDMFLCDLMKNIRKGYIGFTVKEIKYSYLNLPLLILGDRESVKTLELSSYAQESIVREIQCSNYKIIPLVANDDILSKHEFSLDYIFNKPKTLRHDFSDYVFTGGSLFSVIEFGSYLIIYPNLSCMYFKKDEIKNSRRGEDYFKVLKKTLVKKKSFRSELRNRRENLREYLCDTLREIPNKYSTNNLTVMTFKGFLRTGLYITFTDEKYVSNIHNDLVIPFHIDSETEEFTPKTELEIKNEVNERIAYQKRMEEAKIPFDKIKEELRELDKSWYSLDELKEYDGVWHIWLNPRQQNKYNSGWFTIEDLKDWCENKGKIMKVS